MEQNSILITTLPIKPQEKIKVELCLAPLLADVLAKILNGESVFSINLLNTYDYKDAYLNNYITRLSSMEINYDRMFIDKQNTDAILEHLKKLIDIGIIQEKNRKVYRCPCGRVDMLSDGIRNYSDGTLYYKKNGAVYCKHCNKQCLETDEYNLFLHIDTGFDKKIKIFPEYYERKVNGFEKQYNGQDYLITKNRNTGYQIQYNGRTYNIDIDFMWMNYISVFQNHDVLVVASNHQLLAMYLINYLNGLYDNKALQFVATPYLKRPNGFDPDASLSRLSPLGQKLALLYSLKWRSSDANYDENVIRYLSKMTRNELERLYSILLEKRREQYDLAIKNSIVDNMNFQKCLKKMKGERNV